MQRGPPIQAHRWHSLLDHALLLRAALVDARILLVLLDGVGVRVLLLLQSDERRETSRVSGYKSGCAGVDFRNLYSSRVRDFDMGLKCREGNPESFCLLSTDFTRVGRCHILVSGS